MTGKHALNKKPLGPKLNKLKYLNIFYIRQILIYKKDKMIFCYLKEVIVY